MCQLFISANPDQWESRTRSMRIDGVATSIRLENFFWAILEEIGARDRMTTGQLITKLYLEALDADHDMGNFTSFLRVCCGRYLSLAADQDILRDNSAISSIDSAGVLAREAERAQQRRLSRAPRTGAVN